MNIKNNLLSLYELPIRIFGPLKDIKFTNSQNNSDYNFTLKRIHRKKGLSCLIRAKK